MSLFRSAEMRYFEIFIPKEDGYEIISKLAHNNFVQLLDASKDFHKPYSNSIKRCEEIVHRIDAVLGEAISRRIPLPEIPMVETVFERQSQSTQSAI